MQAAISTPELASRNLAIDTSIVVATCSRAALLQDALESLIAQQADTSLPIEIIVVDDGSIDSTPSMLAAFQQTSSVPLTVLPGSRNGVAAARNLGSEHARGQWLASFDDDQIALPGWLYQLRQLADSTGAACVGGALELKLPSGVAADSLGPRARRVLGEHLPADTPMRYPSGVFPATNNVLIRRSVFAQLGGYDESFTEGGEDKDFFARVAASGQEIWFQPASRALHITPALRLQLANLRWTSLRLGASDVRVAQRKRPFFGPCILATSRTAAALLRDLPRLVVIFCIGGRDASSRANDVRCSLWYNQGVLRALPAILFPKLIHSQFLNSMDFRSRNGERADATSHNATD